MSDAKRYVPYSKGAVLEYVEGMDAGCIPMVLASDYEREVAALRQIIKAFVDEYDAAVYAAVRQGDADETAGESPAITAARAAVNQGSAT